MPSIILRGDSEKHFSNRGRMCDENLVNKKQAIINSVGGGKEVFKKRNHRIP